jgi:glucose-1-phosphate cytidylyltransferase
MSEALPVVILCGGQGTRMGGDGQTKKELVEVGGRAIIWHVMRIYAAFGWTHFILTLGHMSNEMKRYFLDLKTTAHDLTLTLGTENQIILHHPPQEAGWKITMVDTGLETPKGSRIGRVAPYLGDTASFAVTYGDGVGNVDLDALLRFHLVHGKLATITGVRPSSQYGIAHVDDAGRVSGFEEKPLLDHWINAGFMIFRREVLDYLVGDDVDLERHTLVQLAAEGQLMMYRHTGFWRSMDTFKEAVELDQVWRQQAPWKVW